MPDMPITDNMRTCYGFNLGILPRKEALTEILTVFPLDEAEQLLDRAIHAEGAYVLFDPEDDGDGFLLVGDDPDELARLAIEHFEPE